ncbi:glycoside hydrolase family 43 protein [Levilactobacillus bambusae]|uniref:Glycoside hydrolase 43 family protein n=1 Tax=Levilactobacillus bambusae TaxID=2024736 RepID=A0A2V1N1E6_9LACO|nr:glycoside hydrolase family 43 protein [Levilactobacillus bambusae]PWG00558.1 glycoside hydrolase 43 family protein [Levilactobacillus bambusae]
MKIQNPVLPGFNPDPSMIRVGDTYYIANSTFEWFPGVRLHESKDMVHWNELPSPLASVTMLDMAGNPASGGIWAPDLSYADGKFWLVFTDVKVTEGPFKDMHNYVTTATDIRGPWTKPTLLNGVGFDESLFHDDDGRKYLVQQTWDHREYKQPFNGITLTEIDPETLRVKPETARTIYRGTDVKLVEGPHLYKIKGQYYLFAAQGGTVWTHQEVVARSASLTAESFVTEPGEPFITNFDTPDSYLQKQGHGALVSTPGGEWYYASLTGRPWHHDTESVWDPRGWCTLGRETAIQKVEWDAEGWPRIVGGHGGQTFVEAPKDAIHTDAPDNHSYHDNFTGDLDTTQWNTLRIPFTSHMGRTGDGKLTLVGHESFASNFDVSLVGLRWQAFNFDAQVKVEFDPYSYQQMAGLTNFYNDKHYSWVFITWDEERGHVIEVAQNDNNQYTSFLKDAAIQIPAGTQSVWFKTKVRTSSYSYAYSLDGKTWQDIPVELDAAVVSDDYVLQTYGGFFTGAFVGLAAVDYAGYNREANFYNFDYAELAD